MAEHLPAKIFAGVDVTKEPARVLPTVHYNVSGIAKELSVINVRTGEQTLGRDTRPLTTSRLPTGTRATLRTTRS